MRSKLLSLLLVTTCMFAMCPEIDVARGEDQTLTSHLRAQVISIFAYYTKITTEFDRFVNCSKSSDVNNSMSRVELDVYSTFRNQIEEFTEHILWPNIEYAITLLSKTDDLDLAQQLMQVFYVSDNSASEVFGHYEKDFKKSNPALYDRALSFRSKPKFEIAPCW
jgi:hypothetical protein